MIEQILVSALFAYGYCTAFTPGNIFDKVGEWAEINLPQKLWKPIGGCSVCTAFWVATLMYWIFWGDYWVHWLMISVSAVGVNAIVTGFMGKMDDIADAIDPPE